MPRRWCFSARCSWSTLPPSPSAFTCARARSGNVVSHPAKVSVENLRLSYGDNEVLHGISFQIHAEEILGIIGPAQSGKTSLLRCLNRTIDFIPDARVQGRIQVD